ncbi:methyltransferase [Streptomyces antimycoticus]|uniref:Methyltransferase n=1 Tax=Streptomyces antimycoticus TaxID=68175 RepID=A0A499UJY2_9ACTN|nr:methyltransferase [Streptomyces antimycoticus]
MNPPTRIGGDLQSGPQSADATNLPRNTILIGDVRERLAELPAASVDTIITSPPYFGVRDYGHEQQLGAEPDVDGWVNGLQLVARELARVLRPNGSLWLNLGDSYSRRPAEGAAPKSLLLGPARVALALVRDGWTLRNEVIWAKTNPMPSSVADRLTTTHELIYFFTRSPRYYFDLDPIRRPLVSGKRQNPSDAPRSYPPAGIGAANRKGWTLNNNRGLGRLKASGLSGHPLGKNPGDVWTLPTAGFRGGHFAAFPMSLAERPLLAACPERVCSVCGQPWHRALERRDGRLLAVGDLEPTCMCGADGIPGVVLDPFMGTGTTALAAEKHGRDWIGIELNPAYAELAEQRLRTQRAKQRRPAA